MTDKQWKDFLKKVGTRLEEQIEKYGRYEALYIPTRQQADYIYDKIKEDMQKNKPGNTNYMRTMINNMFAVDKVVPAISDKEYSSSKSIRLKNLIEYFGVDKDTAREIINIKPPTATDFRYGRKNVSEYWAKIDAMQDKLKKSGYDWATIRHMMGVAMYGKEY